MNGKIIHVLCICLLLILPAFCQDLEETDRAGDEHDGILRSESDFEQDEDVIHLQSPGVSSEAADGCDPELPNLTVGDYFVDEDTSLDKLKKLHKVMILQISKSSCKQCCKGEPIVNFMKKLFKDERIAYKQKKIPIVRIDLDKYPNLPQEEGITTQAVPQLVLYLNGKYYEYTEHFNVEFFLLFMNRHLFPVVLLKTEEDIEKFRDVETEWKENTPFYKSGYQSYNPIFDDMQKQTRVIAFVAEKSDFKAELKLLEENALQLASRDDLRIAKVTNPELVRKYKKKYNFKWFDEFSSNSLVLFKKKTVSNDLVHYYDLVSAKQNMFVWLNSASLDKFDVLTGNSYKIMTFLRLPMFLVFLDRDHPKYGEYSNEVYDMLKRIAPRYPNWIFSFTEDDSYRKKKKDMNITWEEEPAAAAHNVLTSSIPVFPKNTPFTEDNIMVFLHACLDGSVESKEFALPDVYAKEDL